MVISKPASLPSCFVSTYSLIAIAAYIVEVTLPATPPAVASGESATVNRQCFGTLKNLFDEVLVLLLAIYRHSCSATFRSCLIYMRVIRKFALSSIVEHRINCAGMPSVRGNQTYCREFNRDSLQIQKIQGTRISWSYGLAVMTSGLHPVGPRFDPGYDLIFCSWKLFDQFF